MQVILTLNKIFVNNNVDISCAIITLSLSLLNSRYKDDARNVNAVCVTVVIDLHLKLSEVTPLSEPAFFYFIFDPAIVSDYFKTKLTKEELDEGGRCSHLKKFSKEFQIAECCITDLPKGLRHSDFPKCSF